MVTHATWYETVASKESQCLYQKLSELSRLRGVSASVLTEDMELLKEERRAASSSDQEHWGMLRVLRDPRLRLPLLLVCSMQAGQQTSGINAVRFTYTA